MKKLLAGPAPLRQAVQTGLGQFSLGWLGMVGRARVIFNLTQPTSHICADVSVFTFEEGEDLENGILSLVYIP